MRSPVVSTLLHGPGSPPGSPIAASKRKRLTRRADFGKDSDMTDGPKIVRLPVAESVTAREALQAALDEKEPLTNVIILSQREDGSIYHLSSSDMTLAEANWIIDSYWLWLHEAAKGR